jgi:membrane protease YdiL (CAAX protease family)
VAALIGRTATAPQHTHGRWARVPVSLRAIVTGVAIALVGANVWPPLLVNLGVPLAATAEAVFLALYVWWASGEGPTRSSRATRARAFRSTRLPLVVWAWGLIAALFFAVTVHAAIVLMFRLVPFPIETFRQGYDFSFIHSPRLAWVAVVVSATSAGICEETGFRGYLQQPIEQRHGAPVAIVVSSLLFMLLHLTKGWALIGMVPIVFGAGVLLGLLAWSSGSLIPGMIGHTVMDIGPFGYWWTGIAGDFTARRISETGLDLPFLITCATLTTALLIALLAIWQLRRIVSFRSSHTPPSSTAAV